MVATTTSTPAICKTRYNITPITTLAHLQAADITPTTTNENARKPEPSDGSGFIFRECSYATPGAAARGVARLSAFSHPDFTVGSGISPDPAAGILQPLAGSTAGQDLAVITRGLTKPRRLSA
jgi:hypothetical protein